MRSNKKAILATIGAVAMLAIVRIGGIVWDYYDPTSIENISMSYDLQAIGKAIYEYRAMTGNWPDSLDDLDRTSIPKNHLAGEKVSHTMVILWPHRISINPLSNGNVVLAYMDKGWFNEMGRKWVVWGNLRTEHLRDDDLRAQLEKQKGM